MVSCIGGMQFKEYVAGASWEEVEALLFGINLEIDNNISPVIIEGDYVDATNRNVKPREDVTLLGFKIQECVRLINSIDNCTIRWCPRGCNTVTNKLSKNALVNKCNVSFRRDIPEIIQSLIIHDSY